MHQLGIRTYAELKSMPATDYDRWRYFFTFEPAGFRADNRRAGIMTATLFNAICGLGGADSIKPDIIFPDSNHLTASSTAINSAAARSHLSSLKKLLG